MKIHTLRRMEYRGSYIYIMQFGRVFQYLVAYKGEIYMQHVVVKPRFWRWLLWKIGFVKADTPYTIEQLEEFEKVMLSGASLSLDTLIDGVADNPVMVPKKTIPLNK